MAFSGFPLAFLQASISTLVTCSAAWVVLHLARRRWPGLEARRAPWLLAQLAGAATLVLVMLPASSQLSLFARQADPGVAGLAQPVSGNDLAVPIQDQAVDLSREAMLPTLAWLWLACYAAGAAWRLLRWQRGQRDLHALLRAARRLEGPDLRDHTAFAGRHGAAPPVLEIDAPVSPLLAGLFHPVLLLPRHVRALPPVQQQLIVEHELTHLRRRDHLWQHAGMSLRVLLWFVPCAHSFYRSLQWAVELGCDRAVLAGREHGDRRDYAAALLAQLAVQVRAGSGSNPYAASASPPFGVSGAQAIARRIGLIRDAQRVSHVPMAGMAALLVLPALCGASVLLQPQSAWRDAQTASVAPQRVPGAQATPAPEPGWQAPLARLRVTSAFGSTNRPGGKPHKGMDFGAPRGTAVLAPADGKVAVSTDRYDGGSRYGKVVVIEHANGARSLYAHLDGRMVEAGERVRAGQQIAVSGATGKVTGPHLHFEVLRQGAHIDPQTLLGSALAPPHR